MRISHWKTRVATTLAGVLVLSHCGQKDSKDTETLPEDESAFDIPPREVSETRSNRLAEEPSDLLRARAADAINWQPWTPQLLEWADAEQRPIFAVLVSGQVTACHEFLEGFATAGSGYAERFNDSYLCSLVDIDVNPEMALLAFRLCGETRQTFTFPILLWLSHEGNPVAWLAIREGDITALDNGVEASHAVVQEVWNDSPKYFIENSRRDAKGRATRATIPAGDPLTAENSIASVLPAATGALTALYDPASKSMDLGGGLVPSDLLRLTGSLAEFPGLPDYLRERSKRMTIEIHEVLAKSPMLDPLDHGVFASRRSRDWSIPVFSKNARTQAGAAISFAHAAALADSPEFAAISREILAYLQGQMGEGASGVGSYRTLKTLGQGAELFAWTHEELEELLTPEQLRVAEQAFGVIARGNIPPEQDFQSRFYRRNMLAPRKSAAEVASALEITEAEAGELITVVRETLRASRKVRLEDTGHLAVETTRIAEYNALCALALLRVGDLLGDPELIAAGRAHLRSMRETFYSQKDGLWRIAPHEGRRGVPARGADYATLLAAVLECYHLRLEGEDLEWAEALARESLRVLATEEHIVEELPAAEKVVQTPYISNSMLLGNSTWGTLSGSLEKLRRISSDARFSDAAEAINVRLASRAVGLPLVHTDYIDSLLVQVTNRVAVLHGSDPGLREALHAVLREPAFRGTVVITAESLAAPNHYPLEVPNSPGVTIFRDLKALGTYSDPAGLKEFLSADTPGG